MNPAPFQPGTALYLHVPFCASSCDFCSFYQEQPKRGEIDRYLAAIEREMELHPPGRVETAFWGGGTPGLLPADSWRRLMGTLPRHYGTDASLDAETTKALASWLTAHAGTTRRVREAHVYSEIVPHTITAAEVSAKSPAAIVLSGGPSSVYEDGAPSLDPAILELGIPVFGICYGFQAMAQALGGILQVAHAVSADRLHDVGPDALQGRLLVLANRHVHLRGSFFQAKNQFWVTISRKLA